MKLPIIKISTSEWLTAIGTVAALVALLIAYLTFARQFGYAKAPVRFTRAEFSSPRIVESLKKPAIFDTTMIGLDSLNDLIRLNPSVVVEMMSSNPIETLRLEVTPVEGMIDYTKHPEKFDNQPTPWVLEGIAAKEYSITFAAHAGDSVRIPIADLLIRLMMQGQVKEPEKRSLHHYGKYLVKVMAKPAGSPTWTEEAEGKGLHFMYFWTPTGFPESECEEFSKRFNQPLQVIEN